MSGTAPAVSVIVCFLDEERFLGEAVASVVAQRLADWELLLVDDGSSDGSTALARQFAANEPGSVFYVEHDGHRNLGLSASRNAGIARARGRLVAFLDADDVWHPNKLEEQVALMAQHPRAALLIGASQYWRSWSPAASGADIVVPIGAAADCLHEPPSLMTTLYPLGTGAAPPPSNLLLRRDVVLAVGGFEASFRGALMLYEDQAFLSKIYRSHPVYVASACWDRYRQRPDSIVARHTAAGRYWQVRLHFLAWLQRDLARTGGAPPGVGERIEHALREARRQRARAALVGAVRRVLPAPVARALQRAWRGRLA
jgi:glycosyltransferase involved in cell wall biosynthesis